MATDLENDNFKPVAVSDFLIADERFKFNIPSFQRGYRWTPKQVEDLLKDIYSFANDPAPDASVYYLQPLVVRGKDYEWEVLDGQQRLTTLRLVLDAFSEYARGAVRKSVKIYDINYLSRPKLNFSTAQANENLDSYYVALARKTIDEWISQRINDLDGLSAVADVLFGGSATKKIKFIWYAVEGNDASDSAAIATFNRLNRGKLKLTPSELIKALIIISTDSSTGRSDKPTVTSMEWNEIERQFMKDDFFGFLHKDSKKFDTRTDFLFNHIVLSKLKGAKPKDDDFAYRWFQDRYDNRESVLDIWEKDVKDMFDLLMQWYADPYMYNYIGFLSQCKVSIGTIRDRMASDKENRMKEDGKWLKDDNIRVLKNLIAEQFPPLTINNETIAFPKAIDLLDYNESPGGYIRNVLLLFNVETYAQQGLRFPFEKYNDENWDIEHVDSQTTNPLTQHNDQWTWISNSYEIVKELKDDKEEIKTLQKDLEKFLADGFEAAQWKYFSGLYQRVIDNVKSANPVADKDSIGNLTLLDSTTNRGYGNAIFPYKRKCVISRDRNGGFVPACTRNLFLKYYTTIGGNTDGLNRITWSEDDAQAHLEAIHNTVDSFFNTTK